MIMKKYLFRAGLFALPFFLCVLFIAVVDPYNFLNLFKVISDKDKFLVIQRTDESSPRGNILWKTIHYKRNPLPNIIIGDSQGQDLNVEIIKERTGEEYYNLCAPGASFTTMFKTFWFAAEQTRLKKVYLQLAFMNYNLEREYDLWHFAEDYRKRPYEYFTTKEIFFDAVANVTWAITGNKRLVFRSYEYLSPSEIEALAQFRLKLFFSKYVYPEPYQKELARISAYCKENDIELFFILLPVYKGVDEYLASKNLYDDKVRFKLDVYSLGYAFDLDKMAGIKEDRFNFIDYFHPTHEVMDSLTKIIWSGNGETRAEQLLP